MKQTILDLWQENGRLSVIIHNEIMVQEMKWSIIHKF